MNLTMSLTKSEILKALQNTIEGTYKKVLLVPPDSTRAHSGASLITNMYYKLLTATGAKVDILPALGSHAPMKNEDLAAFFGPDIPLDRYLVHNWRDGVVHLGEVPAQFMREVSDGYLTDAVPVEISGHMLNGYDRIFSIGQVVPHEVVGMANYTKNIVVGCGGARFIGASHMLGASFGIERTLGVIDTPVRKLFDYTETHFLSKLPITYVLTVTETNSVLSSLSPEESDTQVGQQNTPMHETNIVGLFTGHGQGGRAAFQNAAELSQKRNIIEVGRPIKTCVVYLNPHEFHSTWLGNKAVYRTRKAIADGGHLIVIAPNVSMFGEDKILDDVIRKHGYTGRENILRLLKTEADLQSSLSAPAHLIHGSADGRFTVSYAAPKLGKEAIEGVGYNYMCINEAMQKYNPEAMPHGFSQVDGEEVYFIYNPALGLWV